jgi:hypothetical protein
MKQKTPYEMYESRVNEWIPWHLDELKTNFVSACGSLYFEYRKLAVLEWHLHRDAAKFKEYMKLAVEYHQKGFQATLVEVPNNKMYTTCLPVMFDAMSSGDEALLRSYISLADDHFVYDQKRPLEPETTLYKSLVAITIGRETEAFDQLMEKLKKGYSVKSRHKLYPLALIIEAIRNRDETTINEQLQVFVDGYKKMQRSYYPDYEDQFLCMRGISYASLAIMKGLKVRMDHPMAPKELIG